MKKIFLIISLVIISLLVINFAFAALPGAALPGPVANFNFSENIVYPPILNLTGKSYHPILYTDYITATRNFPDKNHGRVSFGSKVTIGSVLGSFFGDDDLELTVGGDAQVYNNLFVGGMLKITHCGEAGVSGIQIADDSYIYDDSCTTDWPDPTGNSTPSYTYTLPAETLHIHSGDSIAISSGGTDDNDIYIKGNNVGIGTNNPEYKLDVNGDVKIRSNLNVTENVIIGNISDVWSSTKGNLEVNGEVNAKKGVNVELHYEAAIVDCNESTEGTLMYFKDLLLGTNIQTSVLAACMQTNVDIYELIPIKTAYWGGGSWPPDGWYDIFSDESTIIE